jgi:hypothetical protein
MEIGTECCEAGARVVAYLFGRASAVQYSTTSGFRLVLVHWPECDSIKFDVAWFCMAGRRNDCVRTILPTLLGDNIRSYERGGYRFARDSTRRSACTSMTKLRTAPTAWNAPGNLVH